MGDQPGVSGSTPVMNELLPRGGGGGGHICGRGIPHCGEPGSTMKSQSERSEHRTLNQCWAIVADGGPS